MPSSIGLRALLLSFEGRISRSTYWLRFFLPYLGIYIVLLAVDNALGTLDTKGEGIIGVFSGLFFVLAWYSALAVAVKRCHDRDRSGWFTLVGIVPLLNLWYWIELLFLPGTPGGNRFGLPESAGLAGDSSPTILSCPECAAPYSLADYRTDAQTIYCSTCRAQLPRHSRRRKRSHK